MSDSLSPVNLYLDEIGKIPLLSKEQEVELAKRIEAGGEDADEAYKLFFKSNLRLVVNIAKRFVDKQKGLSFADIIQNGNLGLGKAVLRFNWRKGYRFTTYATFWIVQSIAREYEISGETIKKPCYIHTLRNHLRRVYNTYCQLHFEEPTLEVWAEASGMEYEDFLIGYSTLDDIEELDAPIGDSPDSETFVSYFANQSEYDEDRILNQIILEDLFRDNFKDVPNLLDSDKNVLSLRFGFEDGIPHTLEEVGTVLKITRERIRQIETRTLGKVGLWLKAHYREFVSEFYSHTRADKKTFTLW